MRDDGGRGPIAWMANNPVSANFLMLVCLVGGLVMGAGIKQEIFPDFELGTVTVSVSYPGAGPEEVESGIIQAIEEVVQGLEGVDEVTSTASENAGSVIVEALDGADITRLAADIEQEVNRITTFPDGAEDPVVRVNERRREVISFAVFGEVEPQVLRSAAEAFRDRLLADSGITQVELGSVPDHEIHIEIPQFELRRLGLTLSGVATDIAGRSIEIGGGSIEAASGEILIRLDDRKEVAATLQELPLKVLEDGSRIRLGDVATVTEGFEDTDFQAYFNGKPAIRVQIYRVGDQTPIAVAEAAKAVATAQDAVLPEGLSVSMVRDLSSIFRQRGTLLLKNAAMGLGIVFICLALFLEIRLAFWVSMGIPISFLGAFLLFPATHFTINMVTMFAFIITLGIVVDDAVVVGENVHAMREKGCGALSASIRGAREVAMPVTFSVLTNIVAFLPMIFVPGWMGKIFGNIPVVVTAVFAISLVESLFILPAHLGHQKIGGSRAGLGVVLSAQQRFSEGFSRFVIRHYRPLLARAVSWRYAVLATGIAILAVTLSFVLSGKMGFELFPKVESDYAFVRVELPSGVPDARVEAVERRLVAAAGTVVAESGGTTLSRGIFGEISGNVVTVRVYLTPPDIRPVGTTEVVRRWRAATGEIAGAESVQFLSDRGGPGSGRGLTVELSHRDIDTLEKAAVFLADRLSEYPIVQDVDDGSAKGKRQFAFSMTPEGERLGLDSVGVGTQVRAAYEGVVAQRFQRGRNEVTVRIRRPEAERTDLLALENFLVTTPRGSEVRLADVVRVEEGRAFVNISRKDGRRIVNVTADVRPARRAEEIVTAVREEIMPDLLSRYPGTRVSFAGKQADLRESRNSLFVGLGLALLAIFALLAIPFKSYIQPVIIMGCIPFGIVGAVFGHILMGYSLSIMSLFGIVALSGVVVNDSLVLIDFANRLVREGTHEAEAIVTSGAARFRPILLTTLTTFGGLAPMIFETSRQARFLIPMAISLGFGILFATLITLFLVPCFYMVLEDLRNWWRR